MRREEPLEFSFSFSIDVAWPVVAWICALIAFLVWKFF